MSIGPAEIIIVLVIAFLVFGPNRMPEMGRQLGRAVREFRRAADTAKSELGLDEMLSGVSEVKDDVTSALGVDELKAGFSEVTGSLGLEEIRDTVGTVSSGVGSVKTALGDPAAAARSAVKGAVTGTPGKKGTGEAAAEPEPVAAAAAAAEPETPEATAGDPGAWAALTGAQAPEAPAPPESPVEA